MDINKPIHSLKIYAARQLAKLYPKEMFIAVTGSVGKTTCIQACLAVLSQKYKTLVMAPTSLLKLKPAYKKVILEMGVSRPGEMDSYLSIVKPKTAIVTRVALGQTEEGKLIASLPGDGTAILNWDDVNCQKLAPLCQGEVIYFGTDSNKCTVWAGNIKIDNYRTNFELNLGVERVKVNLSLLGAHQIYPVLAAATLGITSGISLTKIKIALESISPTEHRMQAISGPNGSVILDDTYNSSPASLESAIDTLMQIPARRRILVIGEMKDLGEDSEKQHKETAQIIYKEKPDLVLLGSGDCQFIATELQELGFLEERIEVNLQNSQIVTRLLRTLGKGDICLIKGSRVIRLDEVVKRISKK